MNRVYSALIGGSLAVHLGVFAWMGMLPKERRTNAVAIALAESKSRAEESKPPPPPKPAIRPERPKVATPATPKPAPAPSEPPPSENSPPPPTAGDAPGAMDGFADLGSLGAGGNGFGVATGAGQGPRAATSAAPAQTTRKVLELAAPVDECKEEPVKPELVGQVQPAYTAEGRQASVEGVVKLEVAVDEAGRVTRVRVIKGLGFGLDEAAAAAARQWTFKPATRCGKPVAYVVKPGVRFQLGS